MKVSIVMGSISDRNIAEKVIEILEKFDVEYEQKVISAHRTPYKAIEYAESAEENGIEVIIAIAGKAAHLAGVIAGVTPLPVIGLPVKSSTMDGIDSLLSIVQMPGGVPVGTMAINGAKNAGLYAISILANKDDALSKKLEEFRSKQTKDVLDSEL